MYQPTSPEWLAFCNALEGIARYCDERGLEAPVLAALNQGTHPARPTDYARPDAELRRYLSWYHRAEEAARRAGFTVLNFEAELAAELRDEPLGVTRWDAHPSAACNRLYGEKLAETIAPLVASPTPSPQ